MRVALVALTGQPGPVGDCHMACGTATVPVERNDSGTSSRGNAAYVIGWSLADGLYPLFTLLGLRLAGRRIPRLVPV